MEQQNYALGTVGWSNDANYYDLGAPGTDRCLVRVTLVWGRNPAQALTGQGAQGMKIVATLPGPIFHLPNLGDLVELAIPQDMERMPGAATIRGWHKPTPQGFSASNAMWPIDNGKFAIIGDSSAVAAALATVTDNWLSAIKTAFNKHVHTASSFGTATTPPQDGLNYPAVDLIDTPASLGSTAAQKVKIT